MALRDPRWTADAPITRERPACRSRSDPHRAHRSQLPHRSHGRSAAAAGLAWAAGVARSEPLARYVGEALDSPPDDDAAVDAWLRSRHTHYWHPAGSCRMGARDDASAVVDHEGRVRGVDGLRMPTARCSQIPRARRPRCRPSSWESASRARSSSTFRADLVRVDHMEDVRPRAGSASARDARRCRMGRSRPRRRRGSDASRRGSPRHPRRTGP
jgi:GMC oxidoreductase